MTKKDYKAIALVLRAYKNQIPMDTFSDLVSDFSSILKMDNPRFDDVRFNEAVCK